ncbi:MAG TPA: hypothetical protein DCG75_12175 [Bacteroidales bacterium]|nr:hypothetical protein [Bacteroidales bacterium]
MKFNHLKNIILFPLLFISTISFAQTNIDSLENLLKASSGKDRINKLIELSKAYKRIYPQKTVSYAIEAFNLSKNINDGLLAAISIEQAGDGELLLGNLDTAKKYYIQSFRIFNKLENFNGLADVYLDLGNIHFFKASYDSASFYYNKSIGFKLDLGDNEGLINLYNNLGAVYKKTGEINLAIKALENSIQICDQLNLKQKKGLALINLASIYFTQGNLSKAMSYNFEALKISEQTNDLYTKSNSYTNLGNIYTFIEDYQKALEYQKKSLQIDQQLEDWEGIVAAYNNIGEIYLDKGMSDSAEYFFYKSLYLYESNNIKINYEGTTFNIGQAFKIKKDFKTALDYFNRSLAISVEINDILLIVNNHLSIGEIYLEKGDVDKAEFHLLKALDLTKNNILKDEYKVCLLLSQLYQKNGEFKKALNFHICYTNLKDSVLDSKKSAISEINTSYHLQKQYAEISNLSRASELKSEKIEKQKTLRNLLIAGSSIILILLVLYFLSFKNKIKANKILERQNEQIRSKNQEIEENAKNLKKINSELEKLSIVASKTDNAILISNPEGEIEWINDGYTRLYGYTFDEFLAEKGKTYLESSSNPNIEEIFSKVLAEKKSQVYETDMVSKEGKEFRIHTTLTPILNAENEVYKLIAIDSDVTKFKKVEEELQKLLITKDKFFSIIAHDLKNPFNSLIGLAQLLVHGYDRMSPEKVKYFHNSLYQISKNGYELLINLLEWSRSQMGTIQYNPVMINIYGLTEETFSLYSSKAFQKEITLTNSTIEESKVLADQNMLKTILRNLVSNALKFTERGGAIEILEKDFDGFKEITIRDTGIGINQENIEKLFKLDENFTSEGTEDEMGTGLGLILCKEFVEKHGGNIRVESKVGFGSRFIFTLPINT